MQTTSERRANALVDTSIALSLHFEFCILNFAFLHYL